VLEALLTAYADIGQALPRFDRYQKAFSENPEFQGVLSNVYRDILEFHQRAYKFFKRRGNLISIDVSNTADNQYSMEYHVSLSMEGFWKPL
jgi:hypothetical protein